MGNVSGIITIKELITNGAVKKGDLNLAEDRVYSVPAYQREIRWEKKNVQILLEDVYNAGKYGKFLGSVLLKYDRNGSYDIIDGQQRISVVYLILKAINQKTNSNLDFCKFENKTFEKLDAAIEEKFCDECSKKKEIIDSDILEQFDGFKEIWNEIQLNIKDGDKAEKIKSNLLNCTINLLVSDADDNHGGLHVDYYLDLNDKSVPLDSIDILKANLFKIDYDKMSEKWGEVQREIKCLKNNCSYSLNTVYHHYLSCIVNKYLPDGASPVNTLRTDLKLQKEIYKEKLSQNANAVSNKSQKEIIYKKGDHVTRIFQENVLQQIIEDLLTVVKNMQHIVDRQFDEITKKLKMIKDKKGKSVSDVTISCIQKILTSILKYDNEVPKILVMKFLIELWRGGFNTPDEIKIIFDIYAYSILFIAGCEIKKESSSLVNVVLSNEWRKKLEEKAFQIYKNKGNIKYDKPIKKSGEITKTSGQYFLKDIMAVLEFFEANESAKTYKCKNESALFTFLQNSTAEHFLIPQSNQDKIMIKYGSNEYEMVCPKKCRKYISYPLNYIYLKSDISADDRVDINNSLGNYWIIDKINILNDKLGSDEENQWKSIFANQLSFELYKKARETFKIDFCLNSETRKSVVKKQVKSFYNNLEKHIEKYNEEIKKIF